MTPRLTLRPAPLVGGAAMLLVYIQLGTSAGYHAQYGPAQFFDRMAKNPFLHVAPSELRFWLAQLVLAVPAALLIAWAVVPRVAPVLRRLVARVDGATPRQWRWAAVATFVGLTAVYAFGHQVVLCGRFLTDDENAVAFGARMLAAGHLSVPVLQPPRAFNELYTYQRNGMVSAMDFPGLILFAAAGLATGLGSLVYALASAASGVGVAYAAKRWLGPRGCVLAAVIWIVSPMTLSLSCTSHGQVSSRLFIALALVFASRLDTDAGTARRDAVLLGLMAGLGFMCRPFELAFLLAPLGAWLVYRAPRRALGIAAGLVVPIAVFAGYNAQITGVWYLPARFAEGVVGADPSNSFGVADRIGFNLGFNVLMLAVFFLGIPAMAAVLGALERRRPILVVLGVCVLGQLTLCLLHDNTGVHMVGPIHLSEMSAPLTILAAAGLLRGFAWLGARGLSQLPAGVLVAGYLVMACGLFDLTNLASLHETTAAQRLPEERLEALAVHHAIVLAPPYGVWALARVPAGTWILEYPHPDPFWRDDVIFARPDADRRALHARFPDRALYEMSYSLRAPTIVVLPLP
jgi:hypothetical protein